MTRDQAVRFLEERGFIARPRDWALGETIFVSHESLQDRSGQIIGYDDAAYVRQEADGTWVVTDKLMALLPFSTLGQVVDELEQRFLNGQLSLIKKELLTLKEKYAHQCRLNVTLVNQNAFLIERNTALEKKLEEQARPHHDGVQPVSHSRW
jgi:hypothetical protein